MQLMVFALALLAAGIRSVQYAPNELTTFELERRTRRGDDEALAEQRLREAIPLLHALQRCMVLLLTVLIIALLMSAYGLVAAVLFSLLWLLAIEAFESNDWVMGRAKVVEAKIRGRIYKAINLLRPILRLIADKRLLVQPRATAFYSKDELLSAVQRGNHIITAEEQLLIRQALAYSNIRIADIMTPRSMVITAEATDAVGPLVLDQLHKSGHSRFPVIKGNLDHVVGMLYMHNLVPLDPRIKVVADAATRKVRYVHQDKTLDHALHAFLHTRQHLFIVVNEFEETTGVVSIEDILESIIGRKIVDEFDKYEDLRAVARLAAAKTRKSERSEHV